MSEGNRACKQFVQVITFYIRRTFLVGGVVVLGVQLRAQWITEGTGGSKKGETEYKFRNNGGHWAA